MSAAVIRPTRGQRFGTVLVALLAMVAAWSAPAVVEG